MIEKFREFLKEHGLLELYCKCASDVGMASTGKLDGSIQYDNLVSGAFSWMKAENAYGIADWVKVSTLWHERIGFTRGSFEYDTREDFIMALRNDKKQRILKEMRKYKC